MEENSSSGWSDRMSRRGPTYPTFEHVALANDWVSESPQHVENWFKEPFRLATTKRETARVQSHCHFRTRFGPARGFALLAPYLSTVYIININTRVSLHRVEGSE